MRNCRDCKYNTYSGNDKIADWVDCAHPITIAKTPKPEAGDPAWVNFMTADRPTHEMITLMGEIECATWEGQPS